MYVQSRRAAAAKDRNRFCVTPRRLRGYSLYGALDSDAWSFLVKYEATILQERQATLRTKSASTAPFVVA